MARKTKAELKAEQEAYLAQVRAEEEKAYPQRLMALLERSNKYNFELEVKEGLFVVRDRDSDWNEHYKLGIHYTEDYYSTLDSLEFSVQIKEEAEREAQRRYQLKQAALGKLTPEEREVLGL